MSEAAGKAPPRSDQVGRRLLIGIVLVLGLILAWFIGAAVIPRWWAQRIGDRVDGSLTTGTILGLITGTVFTALPLLTLWAGVRFRDGWRRFVGFALIAAALASPNLFTLGIVLGNGNAAHAGERILDVDGPGFRGGSVAGAVLGALGVAVFLYLVVTRKWSRRKAGRFKDQLRERDARDKQAAQTDD